MSFTVDIQGLDQVRARLAKFEARKLDKAMRKATVTAVKVLVAPMKAAAPRGKTGKLRRSITARKGRGISAVVGPRSKTAFYRHMVIRGTKPHVLKGPGFVKFPDGQVRRAAGIRHPGSRGNDFVDFVVDRHKDEMLKVFKREVVGDS